MDKLRQVWLTLLQRGKQAVLFPQTIADAAERRKQRTVWNLQEAERLDRIRNPSKYLGK